jgi:flagellar P-ring protein precursor FlgI
MNVAFTNPNVRLVALPTYALIAGALLSMLAPIALAATPDRRVLIRDITSVEGVRDNMLVGYGLVVGLNRTGDTQQTYFTVQTLANAMQKMGVLISPASVTVKNVAAVFITASLPPFARPGAKLDVTVSSVGDAKSLAGGVLLMSALHGPDGQIYAEAQGPLVMGGYTAGNGTNGKEVNSVTVGAIPNGGIIVRNPDFTTAKQIADVVNENFNKTVASALDSSRVDVSVADAGVFSVPVLISRVQNLALSVSTPAMVVVNERTGTIVLGGDVKLTPVSVIHGSLSIEVVTTYAVEPIPGAMGPGWVGSNSERGGGVQGANTGGATGNKQTTTTPEPENGGRGGDRLTFVNPTATLVPQTRVDVTDLPAQNIRLDEGANVEELVNGLRAIGTTSRDVIAILQAIKAEGGLQADLEVQ